MSQTSVNVIAGNDAKASDINKIVADIAEIYAGGPGVPVGGIIYWWSDNTVPLNYKVCDGTTISSSGSPLNGLTIPNLIDRFIRGVAQSNVRTTPVSGGEDTHVLTEAEMPSHAHGVYDPGHAHGVYDPGHGHDLVGRNQPANVSTNSGTVAWGDAIDRRGGGVQGAGSNIGIYGSGTGIGIYATGGSQAHNNIPNYRGMVAIMRIK